MTHELEEFLSRVPDLQSKTRREMLAIFAYFLNLQQTNPIVRPSDISRCFDQAGIPGPGNNASREMEQSGSFFKSKIGWQLRREVRDSIAASLVRPRSGNQGGVQRLGGDSTSQPDAEQRNSPITFERRDRSQSIQIDVDRDEALPFEEKNRNVFVVYGRDSKLNDAIFSLLRALGLNPIEWTEAARATGEASPTNLQIVKSGFSLAQAALVLFTPDESAILKDDLAHGEAERRPQPQSRPNVYFEAGIAMTLFERRTVLVEVGEVREVSDISGRNSIRVRPHQPQWRHALAERLRTAGCAVRQTGTDWLTVGDFTITTNSIKRGRRS